MAPPRSNPNKIEKRISARNYAPACPAVYIYHKIRE